MKVLVPTEQLLAQFKSQPDTLIFEGYATNADSVVIYNDGDSYALLAHVKGAQECCIKTNSENFVLEFVETLHGKVKFCGVDSFVTEILRSRYHFLWENNCYLYSWNGKPLPHVCTQVIRPMQAKFAQKVSDGTFYHAAIDDVTDCLNRHPSAAVYVDGEPVCWCLLHLEKSLGMLYTEPQHRHKGYALEVMTALCSEVIARGDVPYAYIVKDNIASINLASKYNLAYVKPADYFEIDFGSSNF